MRRLGWFQSERARAGGSGFESLAGHQPKSSLEDLACQERDGLDHILAGGYVTTAWAVQSSIPAASTTPPDATLTGLGCCSCRAQPGLPPRPRIAFSLAAGAAPRRHQLERNRCHDNHRRSADDEPPGACAVPARQDLLHSGDVDHDEDREDQSAAEPLYEPGCHDHHSSMRQGRYVRRYAVCNRTRALQIRSIRHPRSASTLPTRGQGRFVAIWSTWRRATRNGRCYGVPHGFPQVRRSRKWT